MHSLQSELYLGILRDKTMQDKLVYNLNYDKQNYVDEHFWWKGLDTANLYYSTRFTKFLSQRM